MATRNHHSTVSVNSHAPLSGEFMVFSFEMMANTIWKVNENNKVENSMKNGKCFLIGNFWQIIRLMSTLQNAVGYFKIFNRTGNEAFGTSQFKRKFILRFRSVEGAKCGKRTNHWQKLHVIETQPFGSCKIIKY